MKTYYIIFLVWILFFIAIPLTKKKKKKGVLDMSRLIEELKGKEVYINKYEKVTILDCDDTYVSIREETKKKIIYSLMKIENINEITISEKAKELD